jgi:hypothetical protein
MNATVRFVVFGYQVGSIRLDIDLSALFGTNDAAERPVDRAAKRISRRWVEWMTS